MKQHLARLLVALVFIVTTAPVVAPVHIAAQDSMWDGRHI